MIELTARTEAGARLVALAEGFAAEFAAGAGAHDRDATYPFAHIEALRRAGYLAAPIPPEVGGMGVTSVHDLLVAESRLARGHASVAIGVNMHMTVLRNIVRRFETAVAAGNARRAAAFEATLGDLVR
jgi:alkylation response protein AidB-like acyl-CoA dehydrogenase